MNKKDLRIVKRFKKLLTRKIIVHELKVYGSRARGDFSYESDLDVFVVTDSLDHAMERYISECAWEAGFPDDVIVTPVSMSIKDLKNSPVRCSVFIENVYKEGIDV